MASSFLHTPLSSATTRNSEMSSRNISSLFHSPNPIFTAKPTKNPSRRWRFKSPVALKSLDDIPKQFQEENLGDGLMDNYKNVPQHLYGLKPSQMDMFTKEYGPLRRLSEKVDEEKLTSAWNYKNSSGLFTLTEGRSPINYSMSFNMIRKGGKRRRRRKLPKDLPSKLLHNRIVYLGLPMYPTVSRLLVCQFLYLDWNNSKKPIYLYINSHGTQSVDREIVADEGDAYAIADAIAACRAKVYTVNVGVAYGQAAMLLSLGEKGHRACLPHASTAIYMPKTYRSFGSTTDMWIKSMELDAGSDYYLELLSKGTGKSQDELLEDVKSEKYFLANQAIEYGLADKIMVPGDLSVNHEKLIKAREKKKRAAVHQEIARPKKAVAAAETSANQ